jgi:hypothetical protein
MAILMKPFPTALLQVLSCTDALFMGTHLNGILGEYLLFQVGQIIHTPSEEANIQAMRSALIFSAVDDGRISLLEFFANLSIYRCHYPGSKIWLDLVETSKTKDSSQPKL